MQSRDRGPTWTHEHLIRCAVRQLLRWRKAGNQAAIAAMQRGALYPTLWRPGRV